MPHDIAERNRDIVRSAFAAWTAGTAPITDLFAPQMVWRIEGRSYASRQYTDRREFVDEVLAPLRRPLRRRGALPADPRAGRRR